ncbi:hypothetical protein, partial [Klebsiella pneumoniae]|uniref:hypothetical protein n=1 Tax=Klebsiella pneumoniae TaxID=573 RepID=UPI0021584247
NGKSHCRRFQNNSKDFERATAESTQTTAKAGAKKALQFPRGMRIVNETAVPYTVGRKLVKPGQSADIDVANEDALTRLKTNCKALVDL